MAGPTKIVKRFHMRKGEIQKLTEELEKISPDFGDIINKSGKIETAKTDTDAELVLSEGIPLLFKYEDHFYPTIRGILRNPPRTRFITVDKGAVSFVINGADIMRPGIVEFDGKIKKGDVIYILEHEHRKPLAVGISLWDGEEFQEKSTGKCVRNIHFVGDPIWELKI